MSVVTNRCRCHYRIVSSDLTISFRCMIWNLPPFISCYSGLSAFQTGNLYFPCKYAAGITGSGAALADAQESELGGSCKGCQLWHGSLALTAARIDLVVGFAHKPTHIVKKCLNLRSFHFATPCAR